MTGVVVVLDTSALMAVLRQEPAAAAVAEALGSAAGVAISAGTMVECWVVARRRGLSLEMRELLADIAPQVVAVDEAAARRIEQAYARWGGGRARLNFGDMFAYDAATRLGAPLLYVGDDFARTDVAEAL